MVLVINEERPFFQFLRPCSYSRMHIHTVTHAVQYGNCMESILNFYASSQGVPGKSEHCEYLSVNIYHGTWYHDAVDLGKIVSILDLHNQPRFDKSKKASTPRLWYMVPG
jgi:hypothetical protein